PQGDHQWQVIPKQHPSQNVHGYIQLHIAGGLGFRARADASSKPGPVHAGRRVTSQRQENKRLVSGKLTITLGQRGMIGDCPDLDPVDNI
ncbi:MAG: hypothetical protein OIF55_17405, partial [Amphritea sp.]|nr:hypothetical protein [Amphritea sp.]